MKLTDESIMPFGKHKGEALEDVPAKYLLWLSGEILQKQESSRSKFETALSEYVEENYELLKQEAQN